MIDIVSAESRFAASSKLDDVRVEDSKKRLTTVRPRSVGSFFISRSSERSKLRAVASSRSTSSRVEVARSRAGGAAAAGRAAGAARPGTTWMSVTGLLLGRDEQDAVDLVDLDELHLDALAARGRQVLADVVGADRQLAVAAVGEHGELDARGPAVVEERLDRGADRAAGVEDVVDEDARCGPRAGSRASCRGRAAAACSGASPPRTWTSSRWKVMSSAPSVDLDAAALLDQAAQALGERDAARVDADERDRVEVGVALDDLVRDPRERAPRAPRRRGGPARSRARVQRSIRLLSGLAGPG